MAGESGSSDGLWWFRFMRVEFSLSLLFSRESDRKKFSVRKTCEELHFLCEGVVFFFFKNSFFLLEVLQAAFTRMW